MKGDFTRDTFDSRKHYQQVLQQQGRVQLDADWNEQASLSARRDATTSGDLIGHCGGPADGAAFALFTDPARLTAADKESLGARFGGLGVNPVPLNLTTFALSPSDFYISPGRYYVEGIQCENDFAVPFTHQPDRPAWFNQPNANPPNPTAAALPDGTHLVYLDVWDRHLTPLEDPQIRESALGGVDTATRVKTVWQVRTVPHTTPPPPGATPCTVSNSIYDSLTQPSTCRLRAQTQPVTSADDPCQLPETAGYKGLENQLYRVEIHKGSRDASGAAQTPDWKWSRENGSVTTVLKKIVPDFGGTNEAVLTVANLGQDDVIGFRAGSFVEILDDAWELEGRPGQLLEVKDFDPDALTLTLITTAEVLGSGPGFEFGVNPALNPKLRRWEGRADLTRTITDPVTNTTTTTTLHRLEAGIEIVFENTTANFRTGDYWQIPARAATANAPAGDIEWPWGRDAAGVAIRLFQAPRGIRHHYCRVGVIVVAGGTITATGITDCRCLWPALTHVPRIFYVSGDGQEVMPDLTSPVQTFVKLANPLVVGLANPQCLDPANLPRVRFTVSSGNGHVGPPGGPLAASFITPIATDGTARCEFELEATPPPATPVEPADTAARPVQYSQQVTAELLDLIGNPVQPAIRFNANLSIASQVAYQPGTCAGLIGQKNVQTALVRLATMVSLYKVSGDGQVAAGGTDIQVRVRVASRCGPVDGLPVTFTPLGGGSVVSSNAANDGSGEIVCTWRLGAVNALQALEAEVTGDANRPVTEPRKVHFLAHLTGEGNNDPAPIHVLGLRAGKVKRVLTNGGILTTAELEEGLLVVCDQPIDPNSVLDPIAPFPVPDVSGVFRRGQPTCFITVEIPHGPDQDFGSLAYFERVVLLGQVELPDLTSNPLPPEPPLPSGTTARGLISWRTIGSARNFLERMLSVMSQTFSRPDKILARLTLMGNYITSTASADLFKKGTPGGFLDGETVRTPAGLAPSDLLLPSGDNRRGGNLEAWFWLGISDPNQPPTISTVAAVSTLVNQPVSVSFDVNDVNSPASSLITTATSSNAALIPPADLIISGTENTRRLNITPGSNQVGVASITITVQDDSGASNSSTFQIDVTQKLSDVTPKLSDVTPKVSDVTPKVSDVTPKVSDVTPKVSDVTPKVSDVTPKVSDVTPKLSDVTPKLSDVTPKLSDVTPKVSDVSPKLTDAAKVVERVSNPGGLGITSAAKGPAKKKTGRKPKTEGKSFIRPEERPSTDPGTKKKSS